MRPVLMLALVGLAGCAHTALDETFGLVHNAVFGAQSADRTTRDATINGEEARRIVGAHYENLTGDDASPAPAANTPTRTPMAPTQQAPFRIGAH